MNLDELQHLLDLAWSRETSANAQWSTDNRALGQCAVTALIVQDHLGGDLLWAEAVLPDGSKESHYWNLIDGVEVDLTREQFPTGTHIPAGAPKPGDFPSTRLRVLSFEATRARYMLLKHRVAARRAAAAGTTDEGRTHKQALVLRKDLALRTGKMIAQGAHASLKAVLDTGFKETVRGRRCLCIPLDDPRVAPWLEGKFAKIGLRVESEAELVEIHRKALEAGLLSSLILDAGLTELGEPSYTAVAVGPDLKDQVDLITSQLKLL